MSDLGLTHAGTPVYFLRLLFDVFNAGLGVLSRVRFWCSQSQRMDFPNSLLGKGPQLQQKKLQDVFYLSCAPKAKHPRHPSPARKSPSVITFQRDSSLLFRIVHRSPSRSGGRMSFLSERKIPSKASKSCKRHQQKQPPNTKGNKKTASPK